MHVLKCHILLSPLFFLLLIPTLHGKTLTIEHTALRYDRDSNIHTYTSPRVRYGNSTTSARRLVYDKNTEILRFIGQVVIRLPGVVLTAESARFDRNTGLNTLLQATMYDSQNGAFVEAEEIEQISDEEYIIHKGVMTRCTQDTRAWELRGHRIYYQVDNYAYSLSTSLHFYRLPIFYTPYFSWPTTQKRTSGFLMPVFTTQNSENQSKNIGARLQLPYFIALDLDHDVTITADMIQRRGLGADIDYLYAFRPGMSGQLRAWLIKENINERDLAYENLGSLDPNDDRIDLNPMRYRYSYNHRQGIFFNGQFFFHQHENSDNEINKEYFDAEVGIESHFSRTISLVFPWSSGSLSLSHETADNFIYQSTYDKTNDRETHLNQQPAVSVSQRFSRVLDTPLTVALAGTGTRYSRIYGWNGQLQQGTLQLKAPFAYDFLNIWPSVQRTWTHLDAHYKNRPGASSQASRSFGWQIDRGDLELNFEVYRLFYNHENVATERLSFRPRVIYSEVQDVDQSEDNTTGFLSTVYSWKTLTYQLQTRYQVKNPENNSVRTYFSLDLTQIYNLQMEDDETYLNQPSNLETEPGESQLPLRLRLTVSPISLFSASLFYRFDHEQNRIVETGVGLSSSSSGGNRFSLGYTRNESTYREPNNTNHPAASAYTISHLLRLSDRWTFFLAGEWDQNRSDLGYRYSENASVERLDRQLTDLQLRLLFNHGCYQFSATYMEDIRSALLNGVTTEFLEKKLIFTLQFNVLPTTAGGSAVQTTGAQYQQDFLLPNGQ